MANPSLGNGKGGGGGTGGGVASVTAADASVVVAGTPTARTVRVNLANTLPLADGTAAIGTSLRAARADHVHPASSALVGDWLQNLVAFARANVNEAINSPVFYTDCEKSTLALCGIGTSLSGGATSEKRIGTQAGVILSRTGAGANSAVSLWNLGAEATPANVPLIDNARLRSFMLAAHVRIDHAATVNTAILRFASVTGQTTFDKYIGIRPSISASKIIFGIDDGSNMVASSADIPNNDAFHWYFLGWDVLRSRVQAWMDFASIGSFDIDPADMDDIYQVFRQQFFNGATGGVQGVDTDKLACLTVEPS